MIGKIERRLWGGIPVVGVTLDDAFIPVPPEAPDDAAEILELLRSGKKRVADFSHAPLAACRLLPYTPLPVFLRLRCEWCKQLFSWRMTRPCQAERSRPRWCTKRCRAKHASWLANHPAKAAVAEAAAAEVQHSAAPPPRVFPESKVIQKLDACREREDDAQRLEERRALSERETVQHILSRCGNESFRTTEALAKWVDKYLGRFVQRAVAR
jgi:hypothetical protein